MAQDKEFDIKLQFLDEAQDYVGTLESAVIGISSNRIDRSSIDNALRAAHSIKGGSGMMGFGVLSQLAHRLEDSFKVLKTQHQSLEIDASLEGLLLTGVDCLRRVISSDRHALMQGRDSQEAIDPVWLETEAHPIFDRLYDRLGDPQADDAASMLSPEEGQDVIALLFETEVEGCLQRLESVLADPNLPCLREELDILAQELAGLGEMLQLQTFAQLCESTLECLAQEPERVEAIARAALEGWRRSQALVLVGQLDLLPDRIELPSLDVGVVPVLEDEIQTISIAELTLEDTPLTPYEPAEEIAADIAAFEASIEIPMSGEVTDATAADIAAFEESIEIPMSGEVTEEITADIAAFEESIEIPMSGEVTEEIAADIAAFEESIDIPISEASPTEEITADIAAFEESIEIPMSGEVTEEIAADIAAFEESIEIPISEAPSAEEIAADIAAFEASIEIPISEAPSAEETPPSVQASPTVEFPVLPIETEPVATSADEPEATVRVPVKQLEQLNDLFGELIIDRNGLDLQLGRLRALVDLLSRRTQALEQTNDRLRTAYDRIAIQAQDRSTIFSRSIERQIHGNSEPPNRPISWRWQSSADGRPSETGEFDALELDRYNELHQPSQEVMETVVQIQEVTDDIRLGLEDTEQIARNLNKSVKQLQTRFNQVRMRPLSDILDRFPRALRELSLQYGKSVELRVIGGNTLVDRNIIEILKDPLLHLLRNSFDHGIENPETRRENGKPETGTIEIRASHRSSRTLISIRDDGAGIPIERVRRRAAQMGLDEELLDAASNRELLSLIFEPGFSTKEQVTDLSGRGVGMDVVRNNLKKVRGDIQVDTQPGVGTTFSLMVPFTLSVTRILLVESGGMLLAFPSDTIQEILPLRPGQNLPSAGGEVLNLEGTMVQLVRPERWFEFRCPHQLVELEVPPTIDAPSVLISERDNQLVGLAIDRCWGEREVAIRPVEGTLALPSGFNNCAILGDGRVVPLVNVPELLHWITSCERSTPPLAKATRAIDPVREVETRTLPPEQNTILIVDDSINVRRFLALTLEKAGYRVEQAKDGRDAVEKLLAGLEVQAAICDIEMPRLDGYGFLAQIKSNTEFKDLPVMMLTSRTSEKHRRLATTLGATAYFSKPYNERALLQALETSLDLVPAL
ncbi:MAG: response regulator [Cyanobacteriota bacterium]|nr:response regulator [Cyanobacteriota bacterium]